MTEILHTNSFVILVFLCFFVLKWCGVGLKHKGDEGDTKNTKVCAEALRGTTEAGKAGNRLAAIGAESLSVPASKLALGKRTPRQPFGFPGLAGHGSGLRPTRNFTEVSH